MAKFEITHSCGHVVTHEICGKMDQRAGRADWLGAQACLSCQRAAELKTASAATSALPELAGSAKQVAWATKIRAEVYTTYRASLRADAVLDERATSLVNWLWSRPAGWWIDNRELVGLRAWLAFAQKEFLADEAGRR